MDALSLREKEIFESLKEIVGLDFVVIGGYAGGAYALPRFSVDCDVVVKNEETAGKIRERLEKRGYSVTAASRTATSYQGSYVRLEKVLESKFRASFDVLVGGVLDRRTAAAFPAEWVFAHSSKRRLKGKTVQEVLELRVIGVDALAAMKLVASRKTDLRDVFMLLPALEDFGEVRKMVAEKTDVKEAVARARRLITSTEFRKNLGGVYGHVDEKTYQKHLNAFERFDGAGTKR